MPLSEIGKTAIGMTAVCISSLSLYYVLQVDMEKKRRAQMEVRKQKRREKARRLREVEEAAAQGNVPST